MDRLTLASELAANDLESFITQAEAAGIGPAPAAAFDALLGRMIKAPLPIDQTSRSPGRGGSPGK